MSTALSLPYVLGSVTIGGVKGVTLVLPAGARSAKQLAVAKNKKIPKLIVHFVFIVSPVLVSW